MQKNMNARWGFDKLSAGHFPVGTKGDVTAQLDFMLDKRKAITEAFGTIAYGPMA